MLEKEPTLTEPERGSVFTKAVRRVSPSSGEMGTGEESGEGTGSGEKTGTEEGIGEGMEAGSSGT